MTASHLVRGRTAIIAVTALLLLVAATLLRAPLGTADAQEEPPPGTPAPPPDDEPPGGNACPPPSNIGTLVTAEYNGVPPSVQDERLVGPVSLVKTAQVDECGGTVTMPLYEGRMGDGTPVWYILTETDDQGNAEAQGLNFAPKLTYADSPAPDARGGETAVRRAVQATDGTLIFDCGAVDFGPERHVEGEAFPPSVAEPGSVDDDCYSPLVKVENAGGAIYNAPVVAYGDSAEELSSYCEGAPDYARVHDKVLSICPNGNLGGTVTLTQTLGFSFARPVVYLSFDASEGVTAALEGATLAPRLTRLGLGRDDPVFSAVERLFALHQWPDGPGEPAASGSHQRDPRRG